MKKYILYLTAIAAVTATGCRKIETDGEPIIITEPGGGNGGNTGATITVQGRISSDTTFRKGNTYILRGPVYIVNNSTLTIEAGVTVKCALTTSDVTALVISRGSKIMAAGTADEPIIFTSASANPTSGDWGGIILCGKANINTSFAGTGGGPGTFEVEGGINNANNDAIAGGGATPDDNDNTGVLQYVRIEYAGYAAQPDKELNSLTLAAVGRGTTIDHIQVSYAKDDAYEWFGGTVNCKYLIAYKTQDDDFDTDNGFSGKIQFGLVLRDSLIADISTSEAFESDNNSGGTAVTPETSPIFSNITAIGPRATLSNIGNSLFRAGAQIRRNSSLSLFNSIIMGWPQGVLIDGTTGVSTVLNIEDSSLRLRNNTFAGNTLATKLSNNATNGPAGATIKTEADLLGWITNSNNDNIVLATSDEARLIQPFNYTAPDPTPFGGSNGNQKILTGAAFADGKFTGDTFFDKTVTFRGAIAPAGANATWWKGWTKFVNL
ncbi:MAG: hypothetical protein EOO09_05620 [Chitinophagaceae bacterium]|nr:MAG: hypothetical protein EOO09_05620 [Chitinophagaceae bacterium]